MAHPSHLIAGTSVSHQRVVAMGRPFMLGHRMPNKSAQGYFFPLLDLYSIILESYAGSITITITAWRPSPQLRFDASQ